MVYESDGLNRMRMDGYMDDAWARKPSSPHVPFVPRSKMLTDEALETARSYMAIHNIPGKPCRQVYFRSV